MQASTRSTLTPLAATIGMPSGVLQRTFLAAPRGPTMLANDLPAAETVETRDTGRRVHHSQHCGACRGKGCPIVELVSLPDPPHNGRERLSSDG